MLQGIAMGFVLGIIFAIQALRVKSWLSGHGEINKKVAHPK